MSFEQDFAHKDELVEAAIDEFDQHGYAKASLNRILARAEMSKGQFYHHFDSKEALYFGLVKLMIARKRDFFSRPENQPAAGTDVFEALRTQLKAGLQFARSDPQLDRFARSFLRERGRPIFATVMREFDMGAMDSLQRLIEAAHARGEFTSSFSKAFVSRAVTQLVAGATEILDVRKAEDFDRGLDELITLIRRAVGRSG